VLPSFALRERISTSEISKEASETASLGSGSSHMLRDHSSLTGLEGSILSKGKDGRGNTSTYRAFCLGIVMGFATLAAVGVSSDMGKGAGTAFVFPLSPAERTTAEALPA
jgi:hypothetical protein